MTTGLTTGPFALALGATQQLNDPNANSNGGSVAAQFQNVSGFSLSIQVGPDQWTVTSYEATTIALPRNGAQVLVTPTAQQGVSFGPSPSLTVVWLLAGQDPPQPDGPLTAAAITAASSLIQVIPYVAVSQAPGTDGYNIGPNQLPDGLPTSAFHSAIVTVTASTSGSVTVTLGTELIWSQSVQFPLSNGDDTYTFAVPLTFGGGEITFNVDNGTSTNVLVTIVLDQAVTTPGAFIAGIQAGSVILVSPTESSVGMGVYEYGGASSVNGTIASTSVTQILAAPASGAAYRLHSLCATTTTQSLELLTTGQPIAVVTSPGFIYLGGIITASIVSIKASGATTMAYNLAYDLIETPTIT